MKILAIETSCDETAIALLEIEGGFDNAEVRVLGNALLSQAGIHKEYGGVYPNLAKREHQKNLIPLLKKVLEEAEFSNPKSEIRNTKQILNSKFQIPRLRRGFGRQINSILKREPELLKQFREYIPTIKKPDIDVIAVTSGPGLEPALWVGINFAKALGEVWNMPVIPVDHMEGHIVSALLKRARTNAEQTHLPAPRLRQAGKDAEKSVSTTYNLKPITFSVLALLISGGHTELVLMRDWLQYEVLGETQDDAVGEAFDKVARMLELPYPGGPEISKLAEEARKNSADSPYPLPRPMLRSDDLNFSFSGLKTAVLYTLKKVHILTPGLIQQIAREFEDAVADVLVEKTRKAVREYGAQAILIGGGVSANTHIQREMKKTIEKEFPGTQLLFPDRSLTGDNAVMIGMAAYFRAHKGTVKKEIIAEGNKHLAATVKVQP